MVTRELGDSMLKACPVENTVRFIGKKWAINIIRDIFRGKHRFTQFLENNPKLSTKMLSQRLKELEKDDIIEKRIVSANPITVEYHLTKKGKSLNKVIYELAVFSIKQCPADVMKKHKEQKKKALAAVKKAFLG